MICKLGFNLTEVCIPEADKLLAEARQSNDPKRRLDLYDQISNLWVAQSPKIYLFEDQMLSVLSKRVGNYYFAHEMDFKTWTLK
jgi:peptide/nickel transport system substrate-binding protein